MVSYYIDNGLWFFIVAESAASNMQTISQSHKELTDISWHISIIS